MEWKYTLGPADRAAHFRAMNPDFVARILQGMLLRCLFEWGVLVMACVLAIQSKSDALTMVFGIALFYRMQRDLRMPWIARGVHEGSGGVSRRVVLTASDDGLTEETCGVWSFVPWSSMDYYKEAEGWIFIRLKPELWAIIPENSLEVGSAGLQEMRELLKERNVAKMG